MTENGNVNEPEQKLSGGQEQDATAEGRAVPDTETADSHSDAAHTAAQPAEPPEAGQAESVCAGASPPEEPAETTVVELPAAPEQAHAAPIPRRPIPHSPMRLPNCRITGVDYRASLADMVAQFSGQEVQGIGVSDNGNGALALQWHASTAEISCHPEKAGEFEIELCVDVHPNERHIFPFMLTVNPDPKTLWKNIPSDPSGVYAKADSAKAFLTCAPGLSIAAASQRGRSHAQEGKPRDDDFAIHYDAETDCSFLLVADGAGSAKFSREGSRIAVLTALEKMRRVMNAEFWSALMPNIERWVTDKEANADKSIKKALYVLIQAAWDAKARIKQEAKDHETRFAAAYKKAESFTARDYATTLILTIVKRLESGGWFVATYWVGDGGMGIYREGAADVSVQGTPDGGEYGGQTRFLTEDSAEVWPQDANKLIARRMRFEVVDSFDAVILMTDGVTDPKFETERNLVSMAKWNDLWAELAKAVPFKTRDESVAAALLEWMDFWSPGNHDDRTMVVLY